MEIQDGEGSANIRVASLERFKPDDLEGECSKCKRPIFYRPEPPYLITFLCLDCAMPIMLADEKPEFVISSQTLKFLQNRFWPG